MTMPQVVLLDEQGQPVGATEGATVHHSRTPLHLAFSCYVFTSDAKLLLTLRGDRTRTWPGIWTNSCYGHPAPGEPVSAAVTRTVRAELGLTAPVPELVLPAFRYRAVMDNGVAENAVAPVFRVVTDERPTPDPAAIADFEWADWADFVYAVNTGDISLSPWCRLQVAELVTLGEDPTRWPTADECLLPGGPLPAAR
ncbi:isopentenyl-diphosphate Delta-isomerase [Micromonospora echinofusca]|uniref:isopentenyl-diphosphate Delta-isomerase n=1 Tax=Micromonospora echinofusca TaxID=47858 RepID=UPI000CC3106A|nr:isopentenyl-diphosphate Delta-isomerase [Micromonospora sp. MSM11]MCL7460823.1 isopentenyl-diphosphate Delta-isomerase [Micromonospora sp. MSM11]